MKWEASQAHSLYQSFRSTMRRTKLRIWEFIFTNNSGLKCVSSTERKLWSLPNFVCRRGKNLFRDILPLKENPVISWILLWFSIKDSLLSMGVYKLINKETNSCTVLSNWQGRCSWILSPLSTPCGEHTVWGSLPPSHQHRIPFLLYSLNLYLALFTMS